MGKVEAIENQVKELSGDELARFRAWFAEFDGEHWGRQFELDAKAGKLDALAERALGDHEKAKDQRRESRRSAEAHRLVVFPTSDFRLRTSAPYHLPPTPITCS